MCAAFCVADCKNYKNQQKVCKSSNPRAFAADTDLLSDERCGAFPTRVVGLCKVFARTAACKKPRLAKANISKLPKLNKKNLKTFRKKPGAVPIFIQAKELHCLNLSWQADDVKSVRIDLVAT